MATNTINLVDLKVDREIYNKAMDKVEKATGFQPSNREFTDTLYSLYAYKTDEVQELIKEMKSSAIPKKKQ